jgi:hypothetical protein
MSFLGDVGSFESFNLGEMFNKLGKDPERAFIGAGDPFSSSVWGSILGKDYEPIVDQYGGASSDTYDKAKDAGINTGPGSTMHGIARTIASMYAGGAGASALGGGASAAGGAGSAGGSGLLSTGGTTAAEGMGGGAGLAPSAAGQGFQAGSMGSSLYASPSAASSASASSPGLLSQATPYLNAAGKAAQTAQMTKGLLSSNQQPVQASPLVAGNGTGSQTLTQLANQAQQETQNELDQAAQQRAARRKMYRGGA